MNSRFNIQDEDLIFWKPGMSKIFKKYTEKLRGHSSNKIFDKVKKAVFLDTEITFNYLYDNIINRKVMPCFAGSQIVHIAPNGDVYPCNFKLIEDRIIGNLKKNSFDEIWESMSPKILAEIAKGKCMYPNGLCGDSDIYPSVCNSPPIVLAWYLRKLITNKPLILEPKR